MEVALPGPLGLDCEDMFKEITKKLYGEEGALDFPERVEHDTDGAMLKPEDHITAFGLAALMQNGFPPPGILHANFQPKTNPAAEDKWSASDESLQWTGSRIATYNPAQKLFKCVDCECVGFLSRVAEHWLGTHSNARVFQCPQCTYGSAWARCVRLHLVREHSMPDDRGTDALVRNNPVLDEVTKYLQRLKTKVDGMSPPAPQQQQQQQTHPVRQQQHHNNHHHHHNSRQQQQQQQEPPASDATSPSHPQGGGGSGGGGGGGGGSGGGGGGGGAAPNKRYGCPACPYATDRRDLFTRHENIHRDEKPFECFVCQKQFNRADHVKKHFLRMHRDHPYDLNRIRRQIPKTQPTYYPKPSAADALGQAMQMSVGGDHTTTYVVRGATGATTATVHMKQEHPSAVTTMHHHQIIKSEHHDHAAATAAAAVTMVNITTPTIIATANVNTGGKSSGKKKGDKRYTCCYCPWSGVDNWCLKRHLNTHLKPFVCALCDYKAARSERLATHVTKVHNKKACGKCSYLAEDQAQLAVHLQEQHHVENRNIKVPNTMLRTAGYSGGGGGGAAVAAVAAPAAVMQTFGSSDGGSGSGGGVAAVRTWRPPKQQGAARLFNYMEASDGSDDNDVATFDDHQQMQLQQQHHHQQQQQQQQQQHHQHHHHHHQHQQQQQEVHQRVVQDFPEAGDVGSVRVAETTKTTTTTTNEPHQSHHHQQQQVAASPADATNDKQPRPPTRGRIKKRKEDKENNNTSTISSSSRARSARTCKKPTASSRRRSTGAQRSPLLANSANARFDFEPPNDGVVVVVTALAKQHHRSRKQSQPKKLILPDEEEVEEAVSDRLVLDPPPPPKFRDIRSSRSILRRVVGSDAKRKVIFKCKRCHLKFKPNREFYLHYRYCKNKRSKAVS